MAIGKKTGGRDIKEGEVLNPAGRPKLSEEMKEARKLNKQKVEELLNKYLTMSAMEIQAVLKDQSTPALDVIICQVIAKAASRGDYLRLGFILDRLIGKPKDVTVFENGSAGQAVVMKIPSNGRD